MKARAAEERSGQPAAGVADEHAQLRRGGARQHLQSARPSRNSCLVSQRRRSTTLGFHHGDVDDRAAEAGEAQAQEEADQVPERSRPLTRKRGRPARHCRGLWWRCAGVPSAWVSGARCRYKRARISSSLMAPIPSAPGYGAEGRRKALSPVTGDFRFHGQTSWQMSQPNCHGPSSPIERGVDRAAVLDGQVGDAAGGRRGHTGRANAPVGQASRQARQEPQRSGSGSSKSSSAEVRSTPIRNQEPRVRVSSMVFLPIQPSPARAARSRFEDGTRIDVSLADGTAGLREMRGEHVQPGRHHVVIVAPPRVARHGRP